MLKGSIELTVETEHLEKLLKTPHGTILINPRGEIMRANRAFLRMFGYGRKDVKGKDVDSLWQKQETCCATPRIDHNHRSGRCGFGAESLRLRKDGSLLPVMISGYPLVTKGMYRGSYGIYTDISARKNNEELFVSISGQKKLSRPFQRLLSKKKILSRRFFLLSMT